MRRATLRRLAIAFVAAGALCAPAAAASAQDSDAPPPGIGVKLLEAPAEGADDPRAHTYIVDHLSPGTTISRKVAFSNGDAAPARLDLYAAAADIVDGAFEVGAGRAANDLSGWTTISPSSVTIAPGGSVTATVTVAVPADAETGEHYAAALGELPAPRDGSGVGAGSRVGIRLYLSIGDDGTPPTAFTIDEMVAQRGDDGRPGVTAAVHNTGGRAIDLTGELTLTGGPSGLSAGPFPAEVATTLAPGQSGDVTITLDRGLPDGPWEARIVLTSGRTSEEATARLTFPATPGTRAAPSPATAAGAGGSPVLLLVGAAVAGLVLLAGGWALLRRRHRTADASS